MSSLKVRDCRINISAILADEFQIWNGREIDERYQREKRMWRGVGFDKMSVGSEENDMFVWLYELDGFMPICQW